MRDDVGAVVASARVNAYARNTTTPVVAFDDTDANGDWAIGLNEAGDAAFTAAEDRLAYDVELRNGADRIWWNADDEVQVKTLQLWNADADEYALGVTRTENIESVEVAYFEGDRATPTDNDAAYIDFRLSDSAGTQRVGARIEWIGTTILAGATGDTDLVFHALVNNTLTEMLRLDGSASEIDMAVDVDYVASAVRWSSGVAVVAGEYSIQRDADATNQLHFNVPTGATYEWSTNDVSQMVFGAGILYLGDTANANMTTGLTINQGAADNQVFAGKSSDVAHGVTDIAETDTFADITKVAAASGGAKYRGFSSVSVGIDIEAVAVTDITTKLTTSNAYARIVAGKRSVANYGQAGADANLLVIQNYDATRFIFDAEGSAHGDIEWIAFDSYDDLVLVHDIEQHLLARETKAGTYNRHMLEDTGIIGRDSWHFETGRPRAMVNMTKLAMLHHGALIQVGQRLDDRDNEIAALRSEIAELRKALSAA